MVLDGICNLDNWKTDLVLAFEEYKIHTILINKCCRDRYWDFSEFSVHGDQPLMQMTYRRIGDHGDASFCRVLGSRGRKRPPGSRLRATETQRLESTPPCTAKKKILRGMLWLTQIQYGDYIDR